MNVTYAQQSVKEPQSDIESFASLRGMRGVQNRGVRSYRVVLGCLLVMMGLFICAAPALAAGGPPKFNAFPGGGGAFEEVHSTRVSIEIGLEAEGLLTEWHCEYSTSKSSVEKGEGIVTQRGVVNPGQFTEAAAGPEEKIYSGGGNYGVLRHLVPNTTYYLRFVAANADGTVARIIEFTTLPVTKPEIVHEFDRPGAGSSFSDGGIGATSTDLKVGESTAERVGVESNGLATTYSFAYSSVSSSGPWTAFSSGGSGSISVAEDIGLLSASTSGLSPETPYFLRLQASNSEGVTEEVISAKTGTARPRVSEAPRVVDVTGSSARLHSSVYPDGSRTSWHFESAPSALGPWLPVPGASGVISQAEAEGVPYGGDLEVAGELTGLSPLTGYDVRLFAENKAGEGQNNFGEPIATAGNIVGSFETEGPPTVSTFATHALHGKDVRVLGSVDADSTPTVGIQQISIEGSPIGGDFTLTFNGETTSPIAFDASAREVEEALKRSSLGVRVSGPDGGPYLVEFTTSGDQPPIEGDGSGLTPPSAVTVSVVEQGGTAYETHYHFAYEGQKQFEEGGGTFAHALSTPDVDLSGGEGSVVVGQDLPGLSPGETYRYRLVASSTFPGSSAIAGEEQSLTVASTVVESPAPCGNEAFRTGPSAHLPDCRAYEQVTPVEKGGAQELFNYGGSTAEGVLIGADGDHVMVGALEVHWGSGARAGESPYVFSRDPTKGWQMTAATPQPEGGVDTYYPEVFSPDLSELGLYADWQTSENSKSEDIEFKTGPPGGPYVLLPPVPRADVADSSNEGWVAASEDFSKVILQIQDHTLLGHNTRTKAGADLYEYSHGELSQANVGAGGATIGACGANIVKGIESKGLISSSHALSSDGSRVFFEAVPSKTNCSEPRELYMRVEGSSTVDLGAYKFLAANAQGTKLLLQSDASHEDVGYNTETGLTKAPSAAEQATAQELGVLGVPWTVDPEGALERGPDVYFESVVVPGVPAGGEPLPGDNNEQVFRYSSVEHVVQCISCASPFDPAPRLNANFLIPDLGVMATNQGMPKATPASANGDYVFFQTPAALIPSDVDGEIAPEFAIADPPEGYIFPEHVSPTISLSSDVYEWRKVGIDGCAAPQGCLSLITDGKGGYHTVLLGTDESGRDVFFYTNEQLVGQDKDTAGDVYDARIGGGFPEAARPVECEGDACSTPPSAPNDGTPSSFSFSGATNPTSAVTPTVPKQKPKKGKAKKTKRKTRSKKKRRSGSGKTVKRSVKGRK
jgi:hypothetical protein